MQKLLLQLLLMLAVLPVTVAQAVELATYSDSTGVLHIPAVDVDGLSYAVDLAIVPSSNPYRFIVESDSVVTTTAANEVSHSTYYDNGNLLIPAIAVGDVVYRVKMVLVDANLLIFELTYGDATPILKSLPVGIAPFDPATNKAGSIDFSYPELGSTSKIFLEFNGLLIDFGTGPEGVYLAHFTFNLPRGTDLLSMTDGTVSVVELNSNHPDSEIRISPSNAPSYRLTYDHVSGVTVSVGDSVVAGQILGQSSDTKFEADVSLVRNNTAYCPVDFFDSSLAAAMTNTLATLISDWEDYKSDSGIYNEASMYRTACRTETGSL